MLLLRARDVERMEEELAELRKRVAPEPRPLRGLAQIVRPGDTVENIIAEIRAEENAQFEARMRRIFGDGA